MDSNQEEQTKPVEDKLDVDKFCGVLRKAVAEAEGQDNTEEEKEFIWVLSTFASIVEQQENRIKELESWQQSLEATARRTIDSLTPYDS